MSFDVRDHNRTAWNRLVEDQDRWTQPVASDQIHEARKGNLTVVLTPTKPVPAD